ncbi:transcription termination factor MTERF5, chloroplastic-like [Macadamia integrifolia]|uniref:transcription termination factor MTERF5, chloroplastic-like n=1 Tax=Macadamia integrifolia TaxID=60698 RepID=UPI001C4FD062|nr:transcription termination factor MTERF5, chloroplastic-like [Macadamia integrifolia]
MVNSGLGLGLRLLNRRRLGLELDKVSEIGFQIRTIILVSDLSRSNLYCTPSIISNFSFSCFSSVASPAKHLDSNPFIVDYLIEAFGLSKTQALSASKRRMGTKDSKKPESVVHFLRELGFSEGHVRDAVRVSPSLLFADIEKTLKPKLQLFQEIGLTGSDLGRFISKNASIFNVSLDRRLIPCMEILKKIFSLDGRHRGLILVLQRCKWVLTEDPEARLLPNISLLESHGIVGSQLSALFRRQPALFLKRESAVRELVRRVVEMGVSADSRMFVYALHIISCMSPETLRRKFEFFQGFGFSQEECMTMFKKQPPLFGCSEEKLKFGIEVFMNAIGVEKTVLVQRPMCLMYSVEKRVIPRYRVIELLKSKRLLKKVPIFLHVVELPEKKFVDRFISRFKDDAELAIAYRGDVLDSSKEDEST